MSLFYPTFFAIIITSIIYILNKIFNVKAGIYSHSPPCYPSLTTFGSKEFFSSPLDFVREAHRKLKTDIFSVWAVGLKITFVRGPSNVDELTRLPPDIASFALGYSYFLIPTFGHNILAEHTITAQVDLLNRYLTKPHIDSYLIPSQNLVSQLLSQHMPSEGTVDLNSLFRKIAFSVGARNMLGDEFLPVINAYDYEKIFSGFEMGSRFILQFVPGSSFIMDVLNWFKSSDEFEKGIIRLSANRIIDNPNNVFQDVLKNRHDPKGPTVGKFSVMKSIFQIFVFGTGFNSYNALMYLCRDILFDVELCNKLTQEQIELDKKYGVGYTLEKGREMVLLNEALNASMFKYTFPFLLRKAKKPITIGDVVIPEGHIVAYSPQLEHNESEKVNHGFGVNQHPCPAKLYAMTTLRITLSELFKKYQFTVKDAKPAKNTMLVTTSPQPPLVVEYKHL